MQNNGMHYDSEMGANGRKLKGKPSGGDCGTKKPTEISRQKAQWTGHILNAKNSSC